MSDYDRDTSGSPDPVPPREHVTERTTIVTTERGRGSGGWIVAILLLVALVAVLYFVFGNRLSGAAQDVGVNVNIDVPDKVKVELPDEITIDGNGTN